jgi:hypothetical protein
MVRSVPNVITSATTDEGADRIPNVIVIASND